MNKKQEVSEYSYISLYERFDSCFGHYSHDAKRFNFLPEMCDIIDNLNMLSRTGNEWNQEMVTDFYIFEALDTCTEEGIEAYERLAAKIFPVFKTKRDVFNYLYRLVRVFRSRHAKRLALTAAMFNYNV